MKQPSHRLEFRNSLLPQLHRALADPEEVSRFSSIRECQNTQAYWVSLHYMFHTLLGWQNIAEGLHQWYKSGKVTKNDSRLQLALSLWDNEGQLDYFAAHYWRGQAEVFFSPEDITPSKISHKTRYGDLTWWNQFKRRGAPYPNDPFYGGTNPLHFDDDNHFGDAPPYQSAQGYQHSTKAFRASLITSDFQSWKYDLNIFGDTLTFSPHHSWHIEVFDRKIGYLGLFRKSRVTHQWFQGKHSVHMMGNPVNQ